MVYCRWRGLMFLVIGVFVNQFCEFLCKDIEWKEVVYIQCDSGRFRNQILHIDHSRWEVHSAKDLLMSLSENSRWNDNRYVVRRNFAPENILQSLWTKEHKEDGIFLKNLKDKSYLGGDHDDRVEVEDDTLSFGKNYLYINGRGYVHFGREKGGEEVDWKIRRFIDECVYIAHQDSRGKMFVLDSDANDEKSFKISKTKVIFRQYDSDRYNQVWFPLNEESTKGPEDDAEENTLMQLEEKGPNRRGRSRRKENQVLFNIHHKAMMTLRSHGEDYYQTAELSSMHKNRNNRFSFIKGEEEDLYIIRCNKNRREIDMTFEEEGKSVIFKRKERQNDRRQLFNIYKYPDAEEMLTEHHKSDEVQKESLHETEEGWKIQEENRIKNEYEMMKKMDMMREEESRKRLEEDERRIERDKQKLEEEEKRMRDDHEKRISNLLKIKLEEKKNQNPRRPECDVKKSDEAKLSCVDQNVVVNNHIHKAKGDQSNNIFHVYHHFPVPTPCYNATTSYSPTKPFKTTGFSKIVIETIPTYTTKTSIVVDNEPTSSIFTTGHATTPYEFDDSKQI